MGFTVCKEGNAGAAAKELYAFMAWLQTQGMMFGQHEAPLTGCQDNTGKPWNAARDPGMEPDVFRVAGKHPAVYGFDFSWFTEKELYTDHIFNSLPEPLKDVVLQTSEPDMGPPKLLELLPKVRELLLRLVKEHHKEGGIVAFSWHTINAWTSLKPQGDFFTAAEPTIPAVLEGNDDLHSTLKGKLRDIATFANEAVDEKTGQKIPIIFRPYHENNLNWFWWGRVLKGNYTAANYKDDYKDLWKRTINFLRDESVNNLLYAYSPNIENNLDGFKTHFKETCPDDNWVDILGIDFYPEKQMKKINSLQIPYRASELIDQVREVYSQAKSKKKLMAITETGLNFVSLAIIEEKGERKEVSYTDIANYWTTDYVSLLKLRERLLGNESPVVFEGGGAGDPVLVSYAMIWKNLRHTLDNDGRHQGEHYGPYPKHFSAKDFVKMMQGNITQLDNLFAFRRGILFREDIQQPRKGFNSIQKVVGG